MEGAVWRVLDGAMKRKEVREKESECVFSNNCIYYEGQGENVAVVKALEYVFIFLEEVL